MGSPAPGPQGSLVEVTEPAAAYQLALDDSDFAERFAAFYAGAHDPWDSLWWAAHPLERSPRGTSAPGARLRALQREIYSADGRESTPGRSSGESELVSELHLLETAIAAERAAVRDAIRRIEAQASDPPAAEHVLAAAEDLPGAHAHSASIPHSESPLRQHRLALIAASALIAGIVIGVTLPALGHIAPGTGAARSESSSSADPQPTTPGPPAIDALTLLDRSQEPSDLPTETTLAELEHAGIAASSLRRIELTPPDTAPQPLNEAFIGRDTSTRICLFLVNTVDEFASSCVTEDQFRLSGARVTWTTVEQLGLGDDPALATRSLTIGPDGFVGSMVSARSPRSAG